MPVHVPSKLIIFVSTVVSTFISLLAGYLLYAESISVLRSAVDDASAAASKSARLRLSGMLKDTVRNAEERILLFNRNDIYNVSDGMRKLDELYHAQAFASLRSSENFYGGGYTLSTKTDRCPTCTQPWDDLEGYTKVTIWYDPIFDLEGKDAKFWLTGRTVPEGNSSNITWMRSFKALDSDTGVLVDQKQYENILPTPWTINVSADIELTEGTSVNGTWSPSYFWNSVDGTPYAYVAYTVKYEPDWGKDEYIFLMTSWFMFHPWTSIIREFKTTHTELVALDTAASQVFAHTVYEGPVASVKPECFLHCFTCADRAGVDCVMHPSDLGPTISAAVSNSMTRERGTFFTSDLPSTSQRIHVRYGATYDLTDLGKRNPKPPYKQDYYIDSKLDGGEYFLRLTHFYTAGGTTYELLWMRSVASVNEKVFAALIQLIIASVVIFVVDIGIAVLEVTLIARPLEKLVIGNQFLETMDLDGAEAHMKAMYKPIMVKEVARVTDGLLLAIKGLREYKAYLPNTLFVDESDEADSVTSASTRVTEKTNQSTKAAVNGGMQNLAMNLQHYKGAVVRLSFVEELYPSFPDDFGALVEVVHETAMATRGLAHGFSVSDPLTFTLTWNVGLRCTDAILRAVSYCRAISCSSRISQRAVPVMAVAYGDLLAGNLGSNTHKGFGVKGTTMQELRGISAVADIVGFNLTRSVTLVSPVVAEGVTGRFGLGGVTLLKVNGVKRTLIVYEVGSFIEVSEEEWMYQLEEADTADPVTDAFKELIANPEARPTSHLRIMHPTDIQVWAMKNISEGRAMMSYSRAGATW